MRKILFMLFVLLISAKNAFAIPTLQLYIEGATYNNSTQTWIMNSPTFKLWILGDIESYGTISDVMLSYAFDSNEAGSVSFTPTTTTLLVDPSTPSAPVFLTNGANSSPLTGDGSPLPSHSIYGTGVSWKSYALGDFTLTDSPIGDYNAGLPGSYPSTGQINVYDVNVNGYSSIHFDAFDHIEGQNHTQYKFAPFSHDAEANSTPEPASLSLLGIGLLGLLKRIRRKL